MSDLMDRIIKRENEEIKFQAIKSLMLNLSLSAEKAMRALNIAEDEQEKYLEMLKRT